MTKKDFIVVARVVAEHIKAKQGYAIQQEAVKDVAIDLAHAFKADNSRFDYFKFMEACGIN